MKAFNLNPHENIDHGHVAIIIEFDADDKSRDLINVMKAIEDLGISFIEDEERTERIL